MNKRERLEKTIAGEATDRVPVALWRYWPGDDQRSVDLAQSTLDFQRWYDWDLVRLMPSDTFSVIDYGVQDTWTGNTDGRRQVIKHAIRRSLDWTELRTLDPSRGAVGKFLDSVRILDEALGSESVPLLVTIYSPLIQAEQLSGRHLLMRNLRTHADRLRTGLNIITESTLRLIESLRRYNIAGICYVIQHADHDIMCEAEYQAFGVPYDQKIMESFPERWWFNSIQLMGLAPMFELISTYNIQAINWQDRDARPDLTKAQSFFKGVLVGGLDHWQHLHQGTPAIIRDVSRDAIRQTGGKHLILSTGQPALITTPLSHFRAVRESVEQMVF